MTKSRPERKVFDIDAEVNRKPFVVRPVVVRAPRDGRIVVAIMVGQSHGGRVPPHALARIACSTSVLPSDQTAPARWLSAITSSNARTIQSQSSSLMISGGISLT